MSKQRVVIFVDSYRTGKYLGRQGAKVERDKAIEIRLEDGRHLAAQFGCVNWSDPYRGFAMMELPKRGVHHPLSADEFQQLLADLGIQRLLGEAEKYDGLARAYASQARDAERMATESRAKAEAIRKKVGIRE